MRDIHEIIVENLKTGMYYRGLSRGKLAKEAGITYRQMSNILLQRATPRVTTLQKLAEALEITLPQLLTEDYRWVSE